MEKHPDFQEELDTIAWVGEQLCDAMMELAHSPSLERLWSVQLQLARASSSVFSIEQRMRQGDLSQ